MIDLVWLHLNFCQTPGNIFSCTWTALLFNYFFNTSCVHRHTVDYWCRTISILHVTSLTGLYHTLHEWQSFFKPQSQHICSEFMNINVCDVPKISNYGWTARGFNLILIWLPLESVLKLSYRIISNLGRLQHINGSVEILPSYTLKDWYIKSSDIGTSRGVGKRFRMSRNMTIFCSTLSPCN